MSINPGAFNYGSNENYFSKMLDPQYQAERAARKAEEQLEAQRVQEALQAQEKRYQVMTQGGPALISLIRQYTDSNRPALTAEVREMFKQHLEGATDHEFQQTLDVLKASGDVYEKPTSTGISGYSTEGFMGQKITDLHVVEDLNKGR
ncbi:hypothetical protein [Streptomyces sp. NPDC001537]